MYKRVVSVLLLFVSLCAILTTALAYTGTYTFEIRAGVNGTRKHNLKAKATTITGKAKTYCDPERKILSSGVESYYVTLWRVGLFAGKVSTPAFKGNGKKHSYTIPAKKMKARQHTVAVYVSSDNVGRLAIKGSGTIKQ